MYIYLIDVGGDRQCWQAETPAEAMAACLKAYCDEQNEVDAVQADDPPEDQWQRVFRSCERIGVLGNP